MLQYTMQGHTFDALQILVAHRPNEACSMTIYVKDSESANAEAILNSCKNFTRTDTIVVNETYETLEYQGFVVTSVHFENLNIEVTGDSDQAKRNQAFCVIQLLKG